MQRTSSPNSVTSAAIEAVVQCHARTPGGLLPALHDLQAEFGYVPDPAVTILALTFNLSRAEVHGVVSFYHDFRTEPPAKPVVRLCRAEACQARGVDALLSRVAAHPGVTVESVYCLGLCASGPSAIIGDQVFGRLDGEKLDRLLEIASQ